MYYCQNSNIKYVSSTIKYVGSTIKCIGFKPIYYTIEVDDISSSMIFNSFDFIFLDDVFLTETGLERAGFVGPVD